MDKYINEDCEVVAVDNLSVGRKEDINKKTKFYKIDIKNFKDILGIFKKEAGFT